MGRIISVLLATAFVAFWISPILAGGPLADDLYLAAKIEEVRALGKPGLLHDVDRAFRIEWSDFQVFRPLTILSFTLDCDHASEGLTGVGRTNVVLWVLCALSFATVGRALVRSTPWPVWGDGALILLYGSFPAAVEALGWPLAREDLFVALSVHLVLWCRYALPSKPWTWALAMLPGLLAKETAVVLPFMILIAEIASAPPSGVPFVRRHLPTFGLLGAYFGVRWFVFGSFVGRYIEVSPLDLLEDPAYRTGAFLRTLDSLSTLVAPYNDRAAVLRGDAPWIGFLVRCVLSVVPLLVVVLCAGSRALRREGGQVVRQSLLFVAWIVVPLLPPALLVQVRPDLDGSRIFAACVGGWLMPFALLLIVWSRRKPFMALLLFALWIGAAAVSLSAAFTPYLVAHERVEGLRRAFADLPKKTPVMITNADGFSETVLVRDVLSDCAGAKVVSFALGQLGRPPFHEGGLLVEVLRQDAWRRLLSVPRSGAVLAVTVKDSVPKLVIVARPATSGSSLTLFDARCDDAGIAVSVRGVARDVTVRVCDALGRSAVAHLQTLDGTQRIEARDFTPPLSAMLVRILEVPVVVIQASSADAVSEAVGILISE